MNSKLELEINYVLKLEDGKYYIGWTNKDIHLRYAEHKAGVGAGWTKKYPPTSILKAQVGTKRTENELTLKYMKKYGWKNVRGGSWCNVDLDGPPNYKKIEHYKEMSLIDINNFTCSCGYSVTTYNIYWKHYNEKPISCKNCKIKKNKDVLVNKLLICFYCKKLFENQQNLNVHYDKCSRLKEVPSIRCK
ncbi:MAG: hypothetical protein H0X03_08095, partial [Nitrosopumilus sp.]|nr:hypothetical protein [Nitrosopumilus sp.]